MFEDKKITIEKVKDLISEVFDKVNNLTDADKNYIINAVLDDEQLTQEMFNCFEWYLNRYLEIYKESK